MLANLDRQIKNNPSYRQQGSDQQLAMSPAINQVYRKQADTFRSYNNGVDPFKSFTTTSRVLTESPVNQGSNNNLGTANNNQLKNNNNRQSTNTGDGKSLISQAYQTFDANRSIENREATQLPNGNNVASINNERNYGGGENLMTGPISVENSTPRQNPTSSVGGSPKEPGSPSKINRRVRREDSDERETEDPDDDGVWVDDDEDDDNKQQSSDVNETSQQPEGQEEDAQHDVALHTPAYVRGTHGYDIVPDEQLLVYPG